MYIYLLLAGFFGGVVRGLVGFIKHQFAYKNVPFDIKYFLGMSFMAGVIGLMAAMASKEVGIELNNAFTPAFSFIAGYAGGDFLEGLYKIVFKKVELNAK